MGLDLRGYEHLVASGPFAHGGVPSFAGISGGRTSAMMATLLDPKVVLCFENTGREHDATLEFLLRLQDALKRRIFWLEWRPPERKGAPPKEFRFAIVDEKTCVRHDPLDSSAGGVLFEGLLQALADYRETKGLPPVTPFAGLRLCTAYFKHRTQRAFMRALGVDIDDDQVQYIGVRADEPERVARLKALETRARTYIAPLSPAEITKPKVNQFWSRQPFDLEIDHDRQGNCGACFLKDDADRSRVLGEAWTDADWWIDLQRRYPDFGGRDKASYAQLFTERPTRLAVEAVLKSGVEPVLIGDEVAAAKARKAGLPILEMPDGGLGERRFKLVVRSERRYLAGERAAFSCACESSLGIGEDEEDEAGAA